MPDRFVAKYFHGKYRIRDTQERVWIEFESWSKAKAVEHAWQLNKQT